MSGKSRAGIFLAVLVGSYIVVGAVGLVVGRYSVILPLRAKIGIARTGMAYGDFVKGELRESASRAYIDSDSARDALDGYAWTVPNVLTPFVGNGPEPGASDNASINAWQCRTTRPIESEKPAGVFRIFMTGASVLFGSGASSQEKTIGGYLEAMLAREVTPATGRHYHVFPVANPAWASTHERIAVENRIATWDPDLVIALSGAADIRWGYQGRDILWFRSYADEIFFGFVNQALELAGYAPMLDVAAVYPKSFSVQTVVDRLEWNVRLTHHALALRGAGYVFCLQPGLPVTKKVLSEREQAFTLVDPDGDAFHVRCCDDIRARLGGLALENYHFVDLTPIFDDRGAGDEVFLDAAHFGDHGNLRVAEAIYAAIRPLLE